jgi:peptidoglycan/xylan/chitin deacetylase (PgdA/CDA1 family)
MSASAPEGWPAGRRLAFSVNVMLEQWSDAVAPGIGPMGNPLRTGVLDTQARSWAAYGPRTGAWRLLDLLAAERVRAVFYVNGIVAERHPALMKAIRRAGHAIAAHGWAQDILPVYRTPDIEADDIAMTAAAFTGAGVEAPRGFLAPRCTPSPETTRLLAEAGYLFHADYFDRDLPEVARHGAHRIVAMPFTMEFNDLPMTIRHGHDADAFAGAVRALLTGYDESLGAACLDLTAHAHIFGRPPGAAAFRRALRLVKENDAAWLTNHQELAEMAIGRA